MSICFTSLLMESLSSSAAPCHEPCTSTWPSCTGSPSSSSQLLLLDAMCIPEFLDMNIDTFGKPQLGTLDRVHYTCPGNISTSMWVSIEHSNSQPYYSHCRWRICIVCKNIRGGCKSIEICIFGIGNNFSIIHTKESFSSQIQIQIWNVCGVLKIHGICSNSIHVKIEKPYQVAADVADGDLLARHDLSHCTHLLL